MRTHTNTKTDTLIEIYKFLLFHKKIWIFTEKIFSD
nr:MAG TPA: hypothetical protein [Microviridae sp.]